MKLSQVKYATRSSLRCNFSFWLLLLFAAAELIPLSVASQQSEIVILPRTVSGNEKSEHDKSDESIFLPSYHHESSTKPHLKENLGALNKKSNACQYVKSDNRLICTGSLDIPYMKLFQHKTLREFVVEGYEMETDFNKNHWNDSSIETGEWYMNLPKMYQKLTAEIKLKGTGVSINVIISLEPQKQKWNSFYVYGISFSNSVMTFSNNIIGRVGLSFEKNRTVVTATAQTAQSAGDDTPLLVMSTLRFVRRDVAMNVDEWAANGIVRSQYIEHNDMGFFKGTMKTLLLKRECRFTGEVEWESSNLIGSIYGSVSSLEDKGVTITRGVFANMTIKKLTFTNSNFLNDFEKNTFEGLKGVETIAFINSELKVMPALSEFFRHLTDVREIYIEGCTTPNLNFGISSDLKNIRKISLKNSGPFQFKELSFFWLKNSNLTHLSLAGSHVIVSNAVCAVLGDVKETLKFFDVSYSTIREEKELTTLLTSLKIESLIAEGLQLTKIPTTSLSEVKNTLRYLSLKGNHFEKALEKNMFTNILQFPRMEKLVKLNLENCNINYLERGTFDNLPNLKILNMKYNKLENLQEGWAFTPPLITSLDLSHNALYRKFPYSDVGGETLLDLSIFKELKVLNLSHGIFIDIKKVIKSLGNNLRVLYMRNVELQNIPLNIFQKLTSLETLDLSYNNDLLSPFFSIALFKNLNNLKNLTLSNCRINSDSINTLNTYENGDHDLIQLENLKYLDLSNNDIRTFDFLGSNKFPKLKFLNLGGNGIIMWKKSLFEYVKHLETLFLDENKIESMSQDMVDDIWKLKSVKLGNNPFVCRAFVYEILKMANKTTVRTESRMMQKLLMSLKEVNNSAMVFAAPDKFGEPVRMVNILDWSDSAYACFSCNQSKYIPFVLVNETCENEISQQKNIVKEVVVLWLPMTIFVGIVLTLILVCRKLLGVHFISNAIKHAVALTFINIGEKEPAKYNYNVFVSYSNADRQWVVDNLLPRLENLSNIKVCLHERDFQVGLSILENIIACIDSSKNIILVLSQNFLKSHWCQYEMHLAQHRLLEKGRDQLLLIFLENIPSLKKTKTLRYLMMTKTYLEWPGYSKNPSEYNLFWTRLLKSIVM